ncbi:MAG: CinA family protein [Limisphaerales bacterium]
MSYNASAVPRLDQPTKQQATAVARSRPYESLVTASRAAARAFKATLNSLQLNVVTVESLTAGMIAKTLVDTPQPSNSVVYGGFVVYDTDAKRRWCNVRTEGVYNPETAAQMAMGALDNSRAMVAVAVTGQAMPFNDSAREMGQVDIGVAIRFADDYTGQRVWTQHLDVSDAPQVQSWIDTVESLKKGSFAPLWMTTTAADIVRLRTTIAACEFAREIVASHACKNGDSSNCPNLGHVADATYDACTQRSWLINEHAARKQERSDAIKRNDTKVATNLPCMAESRLATRRRNKSGTPDFASLSITASFTDMSSN